MTALIIFLFEIVERQLVWGFIHNMLVLSEENISQIILRANMILL